MIKSYKQSKSYKYSKAVISGKIVASKFIIKQAERYLKDLQRKDLYFDLEWHHKVSMWFEKVCYVPELLAPVELPLPHAFWLEQVHCLRFKKNKRRKYTQAYIQVARKQAKTFYAANNALFELIIGSDNRPEIMCGANSHEQAVICTKMMGDIVRCSPALKEMLDDKKLTFFTWQKDVIGMHYDDGEGRVGSIKAMSRDPGDGGNPSVTVVDELHEAKDLKLLETMKSGQGLRQNPMAVIITSPGNDKDAPCYSTLRDTSVKILDGVIEDDRFLPILFELDNESDWDNIKELRKSNPMMDYMDTLEPYLLDRIKQAKNIGGEIEVNVKIKNCGIWVDAAEVWIQHETILKNNHGITNEDLLGLPCYAGLDLAKAFDLNALALFFPDVKPGIHAVKMLYWIPTDKINNHRDHVDYRRWVDQGWMIEQPGNAANLLDVGRDIIREIEKYDLKIFGYDSRYAYSGIIPMLVESGYEDRMRTVGQGFALSPAVTESTQWLLHHKMDLMHNPVLYWNLANVAMRVGDQGDMFPSKAKSGKGKIDGVSAKMTAICEYLVANVEIEGETFVIGV